MSLDVKERFLYTPCIDCVPETSITFTSSDGASATATPRCTELPVLTSGGSHLERAASSQSSEGYLVDGGEEDVPACSLRPILYLCVSLPCLHHLFIVVSSEKEREIAQKCFYGYNAVKKKKIHGFILASIKAKLAHYSSYFIQMTKERTNMPTSAALFSYA